MTTKLFIVSITAFCTYLCTYFFDLSMENMEQYLAVCSVLWLDGIFGVWAGCKREGFKTYKALRITRNTFVWIAAPSGARRTAFSIYKNMRLRPSISSLVISNVKASCGALFVDFKRSFNYIMHS